MVVRAPRIAHLVPWVPSSIQDAKRRLEDGGQRGGAAWGGGPEEGKKKKEGAPEDANK